VRREGWSVRLQPAARLIHHEGRTEGRYTHVKHNLLRMARRWPLQIGPRWPLTWRGPADPQSSLAIVNASLTQALAATGRVELGVFDRGVEVRHQWPPDFSPPSAGCRLAVMQPWEYGSLPQAWERPMRQVDQIWAYSRYVQRQWIEAGLSESRVKLVPLGVDPARFQPQAPPLKLSTAKPFRFLFVGGTLWRKGIDVLLSAYCEAFTASDPVCLVIKDVGVQTYYKGQTAEQAIEDYRRQPHAPEVLYLPHPLPAEQLPSLYTACDCLVHPYRGEGFGLPVAEAMACGLPVIVTQGGACDDFVDSEVGWLIPSVRRTITLPEKMITPPWVCEPDKDALVALLRQVCADSDQRQTRGTAGSQRIQTRFTWQHSAAAALTALADLL